MSDRVNDDESRDDAELSRSELLRLLAASRMAADEARGQLDEIRQREQALQRRVHTLEAAFDGSDVGVWEWDIRSDHVVFASHWAILLAIPDAAPVLFRELVAETVHPDDRPHVERAVDDLLRGETVAFEIEHRRRDHADAWRWIVDRGRVVERDADGAPIRAAGMHLDITHSKQTEDALWESEGRFRNAFENAALGLAMGDAQEDGLIIESNAALERMLGAPAGGLIGRKVSELLLPDDVATFRQAWANLARGDASSFRSELRCVLPDGSLVRTRMTLSLTRDARRNPLYALAIVEDVTERWRADRRTRAEQRLLRRLLRLQDRERRLIAYEIHDGLVQDLVASKMFLEGAAYRLEKAVPDGLVNLAPALISLGKSIDEGRRLISDLRPMIIDEMGIVEALNYLIEEQQADGVLKIEFRHDVQFKRLEQLLEGTLYRIVQEAINNARRHAQTDHLAIALVQDDDVFSLSIADEGVGFDPKTVPSDRFGLRGIQERARLFGGRAEVETGPGKGTRIHVVLALILPTDEWDSDELEPDGLGDLGSTWPSPPNDPEES